MAKRIPKWFLILATTGVSIIVLALALLGRTCFTREFTGQLVDINGKPLQGAFVLFIYRNETLSPAGGLEHVFSSGILETDENGQFHIPARFYFFIPLFQTSLQPLVEIAYSPKTHSCVSVSDFHESYNDLEMNVHKVTLPDSGDDLQKRAWALQSLIDVMNLRIVEQKYITHLKAAPGINERLVSTLHSEDDFLYPKLFPKGLHPTGPYFGESQLQESRFLSLRWRIESCESELKLKK